ncbi:uncharacterized protein LOC121235560 [Juglans microcarpa x Juglans regia]|uniref:uncharacterized protein LOC121235560 n=1 Tax=Juglans microcarpa x Juglans regia TaxID=2249226 RepID=UPI001B7EBF4F|nr:uncharacterized protein LOC121235560 [Juglans microcarpa x Juglans regia]
MGNGVFSIQHHVNARGSFLQLSEFRNGRRKCLLVIPEGANGIGWKGFLQSILSVTESKATTRSGEFVDGRIVGRPSSIKGASYAAVLRSLAGSQAEINSAVERKGNALVGDKRSQVTLGELEGGVMDYVRDLMIKVDKGLDLVVGTSVLPSVPESVQAKGVWTIGSLDAGIFVHANVTMPSEGAVGSQAPIADEVGPFVQGSFVVEDGGPSKVSSILEDTVEALFENANWGQQKVMLPLLRKQHGKDRRVPRVGEGSELALVPCVGEGLELGAQSSTVAGDNVVPLVSLPPINDIVGSTSDWLLNKDNGFLQTLGLLYGEQGEYEDQFKTLLTAIEASHALETKSKFKKSRELKNLS